jgi:hypothetical protein
MGLAKRSNHLRKMKIYPKAAKNLALGQALGQKASRAEGLMDMLEM